jgi:hypothetical protein
MPTMQNFRAIASQSTAPRVTIETPEQTAFYERVYHGATFPIGRVFRHSEWSIIPRTMFPEDWDRLSTILGINLREYYERVHGPLRIPERPRYKRHYEPDELPLP